MANIDKGLGFLKKGQELLIQEITTQQETIRKLESHIESLNLTVTQLSSNNKTLTSKYTNVLKTTKQLIQFRNSILGVLNTTQQPMVFPSIENMNDPIGQDTSGIDTEDESIPQPETYTPFILPTSSPKQKVSFNEVPSPQKTPLNTPSSPIKPLHLDTPQFNKQSSPHSPTPSQKTGVSIDAPTVYKQIRKSLNLTDFEEFASIIAQFNASTLSPDEAFIKIKGIVKDPTLLIQMQILIKTAIDQSD